MIRVAMWSGPRNISTALMRAWGNRPDTFVSDEPLYAHYLRVTGLHHPGAAEVIRCHESDWRVVVAWLTGPVPGGKPVFYQKHMAHHLLPGIERDWLDGLAQLLPDPRSAGDAPVAAPGLSRRRARRTPGCPSRSRSSSRCGTHRARSRR